MLEKKYAGGNVPLDGGMASAWLQGGEGGLDREKDDPVCRLFTVRKKPAIKVDENGGNRRVRLPNGMNFWKYSKRFLTPPLIFGKLYYKIFMTDMVAYMRGGMMSR